ncbi:MAG: hypothetical protein AAFX81_16085 [Pseudomonadota bacterium]
MGGTAAGISADITGAGADIHHHHHPAAAVHGQVHTTTASHDPSA